MISYDSKDWIKPLFQFHKADTFRKLLPFIIGIGFFTVLVAYLEIHYFKLSDNHHIKNITLMHNLLGFAISMLLVFRTNTAYDRWWEGRKLWGQLVNNSRNLAIRMAAYLPPEDKYNRSFFNKLISMFPHELRLHLQNEKTRLALSEEAHPEIPDFDLNKHIPAQIAALMHSRIMHLYRQGVIDGNQLIAVNPEIMAYMDICGACERIKNTPIPYSYITFIKKFIFIYSFSLPLGFVFPLGFIATPIVMFVFYVLGSLELIAEEIEDPFGFDTNDLPMEKIASNIKKNIADII